MTRHRRKMEGREEIVRMLLEHGADARAKDTAIMQMMALDWALAQGSIGCAKLLIAHGGNVQDNRRKTSLVSAVDGLFSNHRALP